MRCGRLIFWVAVVFASLDRPAYGQTERSLPEAAALFDTAVAHLVDLELAIIHSRAQGRSAPHPDVTVPLQQIASLRELLAGLSDSAEVSAAVQSHLGRALHARLASILVTQRLLAIRQDPAQPSVHTLKNEEALLRARLRDLGAEEPQ
jgi:hypothetical protein